MISWMIFNFDYVYLQPFELLWIEFVESPPKNDMAWPYLIPFKQSLPNLTPFGPYRPNYTLLTIFKKQIIATDGSMEEVYYN